MLYIKQKGTTPIVWHIGEPLPQLNRVVELQADGHELDIIVAALKATQKEPRDPEGWEGGFASNH